MPERNTEFPGDNRHWYALYTRPRFEKLVHHQLQEMGQTSYLPLRKVLRQWSDRKKWVAQPLFSCYVFVHASERERLLALTPRGVVKMLSQQGVPSRIPEQEISVIRRMLEGGMNPEPADDLSPGDLVDIVTGPLAGVTGSLHSLRGEDRLVIHFESIQKSLSVSVSRDDVKKHDPAEGAEKS